MLTLSQLRTFQTVARLNSFSRAADELHLTQPAVSSQIVALENALKVKLFDRLGKTIALTQSGYVVLSCAEDIYQRLGEMQRELDDLGELKSGTLNIGASLLVGVHVLPEMLASFKKKWPLINLVVRVLPARQVIDLIVRNELDIGLIGEGVHISDERIATKPILEDELVVILPPDHPLADKETVSIQDLEDEAFVLPDRDSASGESLYEGIRAAGIQLYSVLEFGTTGAVKRAVEAGLGISVVSRYAVLREIQDGRLKFVRLKDSHLDRHVLLCWHNGRRFSKSAETFIGFSQQYVKTISW